MQKLIYFRKFWYFVNEPKISKGEIIILAIITITIFFNNLKRVPFFADETYWINTSPRLDEFLSGNHNSQIWSVSFDSFEVRPVPSYIVAIGQHLGGVNPTDLPLTPWDWSKSDQYNTTHGAKPEDRIINYSRLLMPILAAVSLLTTSIFLSYAYSRVTGYLFLALCFNPYIMTHLSRAMSEAPLLLFTVMSFVFTYFLLREVKRKNTLGAIIFSTLIGFSCGLAGQSKLTGLLCTFSALSVSFITLRIYGYHQQKEGRHIFLSSSILVTAFTIIAFIGSFPFFYTDTVNRIINTLIFRNLILQEQLSSYSSSVILPPQRGGILFHRIFGLPTGLSDNETIRTNAILFILLCITVIGLIISVKKIVSKSQSNEIILIWIVGMIVTAVPMLFTPLDWDRYYLLPIYFSIVFFSIGCVKIVLAIPELIQKMFKRKASST